MTDSYHFTELIKEHETIIFKITTVYTSSQTDQQDLYQEIVAQLWKARNSFRNESKVGTWIYRIALNTAITRLRKEKRKHQTVPMDEGVMQFPDQSDPVKEERIRMLYQCIELLGELDRGIMLLFLEDKSYDEIASIIGISVSNVGTRLSRIREKLKVEMKAKTK